MLRYAQHVTAAGFFWNESGIPKAERDLHLFYWGSISLLHVEKPKMVFSDITNNIDSSIQTFFFSLSWRKRLFILKLLFLQNTDK